MYRESNTSFDVVRIMRGSYAFRMGFTTNALEEDYRKAMRLYVVDLIARPDLGSQAAAAHRLKVAQPTINRLMKYETAGPLLAERILADAGMDSLEKLAVRYGLRSAAPAPEAPPIVGPVELQNAARAFLLVAPDAERGRMYLADYAPPPHTDGWTAAQYLDDLRTGFGFWSRLKK